MDFFYNPKSIDKQIAEIKKRFRTSMNGEVSHTMNSMGASYKVNYGIEYPRLKKIAENYQPSKDLAERLWAINIREMMILATLLYPIDDFSLETAEKWAKQINQPEQVEYLTMNILSKVDFAKKMVIDWVQSDDEWKKITAFTLSARIYKQFDNQDVDVIVSTIKKEAKTKNFHLYKSMALSLSRLCRIDENSMEKIKEIVKDFEKSDDISKKYIASTVETEISFLEF